jgi:hypothetical protein
MYRLPECSSFEGPGAIGAAKELLSLALRITWHVRVLAIETTSAITAALIIRDSPALARAKRCPRMMHDRQS